MRDVVPLPAAVERGDEQESKDDEQTEGDAVRHEGLLGVTDRARTRSAPCTPLRTLLEGVLASPGRVTVYVWAAGSSNAKVDPSPSCDATQMRPFILSMSCLQM